MVARKVSESMKKKIAGKQYFKCANNSKKNNLKGLENYKCPLWEKSGEEKGSFDESGYEIDHITEFCITTDDNEENLQALCKSCHTVKTKRFMRKYNKKEDLENEDKNDSEGDDDESDNDESDNDESEDDYDMTNFICNKCYKEFSTEGNLKRHRKNSLNCVGGNKRIEYYSCKKCTKKFTRKDSLKKHINLGRCKGQKQVNKIKVIIIEQ